MAKIPAMIKSPSFEAKGSSRGRLEQTGSCDTTSWKKQSNSSANISNLTWYRCWNRWGDVDRRNKKTYLVWSNSRLAALNSNIWDKRKCDCLIKVTVACPVELVKLYVLLITYQTLWFHPEQWWVQGNYRRACILYCYLKPRAIYSSSIVKEPALAPTAWQLLFTGWELIFQIT